MKLQTTKKAIKNGNNNILKSGYCSMQNLLRNETPFAYSSGVNGWACDYYDIDGVIISTGYSPIGNDIDYELLKEYEKKALAIQYDKNDIAWELRAKMVRDLLVEFIKTNA